MAHQSLQLRAREASGCPFCSECVAKLVRREASYRCPQAEAAPLASDDLATDTGTHRPRELGPVRVAPPEAAVVVDVVRQHDGIVYPDHARLPHEAGCAVARRGGAIRGALPATSHY